MSALPTTTDRTPLLNGHGNRAGSPQPFSRRVMNVFKAQGQPSWLASLKFFLFGSYLNVMLVLVPLSAIAHYLHWDAALRFGFSFFAIMPLAAVRHLPNFHKRHSGLMTSEIRCLALQPTSFHLSLARRCPVCSTPRLAMLWKSLLVLRLSCKVYNRLCISRRHTEH